MLRVEPALSSFSMAAVSPRQDADPQSSRTLLPSVIAAGFSEGGTADASAVGIIPSLTSRNNFINFCASRNNGALTNGSPNSRDSVCNPCPIGLLPAAADMPSVKITEPLPLAVLDPNQEFTITLRSRNFAFGSATNPSASFMTAPQQLSSEGVIIGHMHLVIESLDSFDQTTPPDPQQFSYFTEVVDDDQAPRVVIPPILGVGLYRATVSLHATSHQPITLPVLQRGATSDAVYFSIGNGTSSRRSLARRDAEGSPVQTRRVQSVTRNLGRRQTIGDSDSLTLNPDAIVRAFANDGQDTPQAGQVASLTSSNNFINFCDTRRDLGLTDGKQGQSASCNPAPLGRIAGIDVAPSSKFIFPRMGSRLAAEEPFTIQLRIEGMETGFRVNPITNYLAAPQQLTLRDGIRGNAAIVVEQVSSFNQSEPTEPRRFAFFSAVGLGSNGVSTADLDTGLPPGAYRLSSILRSENYQPILVSRAERGSFEDIVYFTVVPPGEISDFEPVPTGTSSEIPSSSSGSPSPSSPSETNNESSSRVNIGAIVGGAIGGLLLVCGAILWFFYFARQRKARAADTNLIPREFVIYPPSGVPEMNAYVKPMREGAAPPAMQQPLDQMQVMYQKGHRRRPSRASFYSESAPSYRTYPY